jgi:hypothetical protein
VVGVVSANNIDKEVNVKNVRGVKYANIIELEVSFYYLLYIYIYDRFFGH